MNLRKALNRENKYEEDNLNITPVMNVFLILVPFMLLTAVFVRISILEFSLPTSTEAGEAQQSQTNLVVTILAISEKGFELKTKGMKIAFIEKTADNFDFQTLVEKLQKVKETHTQTEDIILAPQVSIKYDTIIKVMDRCRENGFLNISISG